jgi:hypothetical protein
MMEAKLASWLPRTIVESALIVISILLALALDEWQEDLEIQELIDRSIVNFQNELTQNKSRIEDIGVYHRGVLQVLQRRTFVSDSESLEEFRNIMEALQPIVLTSSAWETAVATGALGRMDYELVSALTLTYNTQVRFDDDYRSTLRLLLSPINLNKENLPITTYNAGRFVTDVTSAESELSVYYAQTLELISQFEPEN